MTVWENCKYDILYYDGEANVDESCFVEISEGNIRVWYHNKDENGRDIVTTYSGQENGAGHYELKARSVNGHATLHMFEGSKILEGFWIEHGYKGMWRIRLVP